VKEIDDDDLCVVCMEAPKNAMLVHGDSGHQATCLPCGQKLKESGLNCPICRATIQIVIKHYKA